MDVRVNSENAVNPNDIKMMAEFIKLKEQLASIESNTREPKIKEMVWYPKREDHVNVYLRASVVMVGDIDAVKQEFLCEFYMSVKWVEPRLKGKTESQHIDWDNEWEPDIYIVDMVSSDIYERHRGILDIQDGDIPTVLFYYHIRGIFKEVLDVRNFPMDYQKLDITFTSNFESNTVTLLKDEARNDNIRTWNFSAKQQWELQPHVLSLSTETQSEIGSSSNNFPLYFIQMHVARKWSFYISNIAFVMALITSLTFTSFAVGTDSTGDRLQITMTLLLASVAFKYYVEGFLPTVPYLTMIESYIHSCFIFQVFVTILNAVSGIIKNADALKIFEWVSLGFSICIFLLFHLVYVIKCLLICKNNNSQKRKDNERYMALLQTNQQISKPQKENGVITNTNLITHVKVCPS